MPTNLLISLSLLILINCPLIQSLDYITLLRTSNPTQFEEEFQEHCMLNGGIAGPPQCSRNQKETDLNSSHFGEMLVGGCNVDCLWGFELSNLAHYHSLRFWAMEVWFLSNFNTPNANSAIKVTSTAGLTYFSPMADSKMPPFNSSYSGTDYCGGANSYHQNFLVGIEIATASSFEININMAPNFFTNNWGMRNIEFWDGYQTELDVFPGGNQSYYCWIPANASYPISPNTTMSNTSCACPLGYWLNPSGACITCNANCAACFLNNPCIQCISGYVKDIFSGNCISQSECTSTYPIFSPTQTRGLCTCPDGQYYFKGNNSCGSSCTYPAWEIVMMKFGGYSCRFACEQSLYYYGPGICKATCPWPFTPEIRSSIEWYCHAPSSFNVEYPGKYYNPVTGSITTTCTGAMQANYFGVTNFNLCSMCGAGQYESGMSCLSCQSNCECGGTSSCTDCSAGMYRLSNGECVTICADPYQGITDQYGVMHCTKPFLSSSQQEVVNKESSVAEGTAVTLSVIANFQAASGCFASSLTVVTLNKMLYYTRYIPIIDKPVNLDYFYKISLKDPSLAIAVPVPQGLSSAITSQPIPSVFQQYGESSSFILGYWSTLNTLVYVGVLIGVMTLVQKQFVSGKDQNRVTKFIDATVKVLKYNYLLMIFTSSFSEITLYGYLEISTATWQGAGILSTLFAFFCIFCGLGMIGFTIWLVNQSMNVRKRDGEDSQKEFLEKWESVSFLFENFRMDSYIAHSYMMIFFIRAVIFNIFAVTLYSSPIIQCFFIVLFSLTMLMVILLIKPFKTHLLMIEFTTYEVLIFTCNICLLYLSLTDDGPIETSDDTLYRYQTGSIIIYLFLVFSMVGIGFASLNTIIEIRKAYLKHIHPNDHQAIRNRERGSEDFTPILTNIPLRKIVADDLAQEKGKPGEHSSRNLLRNSEDTLTFKRGELSLVSEEQRISPEKTAETPFEKGNFQSRSWKKMRTKWLAPRDDN